MLYKGFIYSFFGMYSFYWGSDFYFIISKVVTHQRVDNASDALSTRQNPRQKGEKLQKSLPASKRALKRGQKTVQYFFFAGPIAARILARINGVDRSGLFRRRKYSTEKKLERPAKCLSQPFSTAMLLA